MNNWRGLSPEFINPIALEGRDRGLSTDENLTSEATQGPRTNTHFFAPITLPGFTDAAVVVLKLTPSGTEIYTPGNVFTDAATVVLKLTPATDDIFVPATVVEPPPSVPPIIIPGPWPATQTWRVVHYNHDGVALGDCTPNNPEFALYLGKVGYTNYDIDTSNPLAQRENCESYGTDYILYANKRKIQGGIHTNVQISDVMDHTFQISGKDWLHWFERQFWPFDPDNPLANVYSAFNRDIFLIVEDWLTEIQSDADTIQFIFNNGLAGATTNAKIDPNDSEDMLNKITALSQSIPEFDFEITPDKAFNLYYPKKSRDIDFTLEQGSNIYGLTYNDKGPLGTRLFGQGQGPSSRFGSVQSSSNRTKYRRLMANQEFSNVPDKPTLDDKTTAALERAATPQVEFTCKIIPDFVEDLFEVIQIGDRIPVYAPLQYDTIDDRFRLVSITGGPNNEGDQEYELGFDDGTLSL